MTPHWEAPGQVAWALVGGKRRDVSVRKIRGSSDTSCHMADGTLYGLQRPKRFPFPIRGIGHMEKETSYGQSRCHFQILNEMLMMYRLCGHRERVVCRESGPAIVP